MSKTNISISGYFLKLSKDRYHAFCTNSYATFGEPVNEFSHSRNIPLICFILNNNQEITHIGLGKRGVRAGTDLRRLNISEIYKLEKKIVAKSIADATNARFKKFLNEKIKSGGLITPKSFEEFLSVFIIKVKETSKILNKYSKERRLRIEKLSESAKKSLAEQKEAVLTALNIAGIDKNNAQGWDNIDNNTTSFLDGIQSTSLREDSIIINDLTNLPGYDLIKTTKYSSSVFANETSKLTVLLANRLPLEELLGTDLIYYNEDFQCFVMVQYKVMEKNREDFVFRLPNNQFTDEIERMDKIVKKLKLDSKSKEISDFRINNNPFFIKICPRIEFNPDNVGLCTGMYIPLDYLKVLQDDKSIIGTRGGKSITYNNIGRYFDNTAFKTIIEGGWIGTNKNQSKIIREIIKDILENGKTAVLAIKRKLTE